MDYEARKREHFTEIYEKYKLEVYKLSLYFCGNEAVANETTARAFFNLYIHYEDIGKIENMHAYLIRTARNITFNWIRDNKLVLDGMIEDLNDEIVSDFSVEDHYLREEAKRMAKELNDMILARLYMENPLWYEVVLETCYFNKPNIQVAKELGVTRETIGSRLYRAKKWIRENFQEQYDEYKRMLS